MAVLFNLKDTTEYTRLNLFLSEWSPVDVALVPARQIKFYSSRPSLFQGITPASKKWNPRGVEGTKRGKYTIKHGPGL